MLGVEHQMSNVSYVAKRSNLATKTRRHKKRNINSNAFLIKTAAIEIYYNRCVLVAERLPLDLFWFPSVSLTASESQYSPGAFTLFESASPPV